MAKVNLQVVHRDGTGKGAARTLRREGLVPAVVYGKEIGSLSVAVEPKDLQAALSTEAGWNALITLKGDGPFSGKVVILKELQRDPVRRNPIHVDFQAIDLKKKVHVMVPVHPVGKSAGEKMGGALQIVRHELEVLCLPTQIPSAIEVDVTPLMIGDVLHINDIPLPSGVQFPHDVNFTVITVVGIREEEEEVEEVVEGEEAEAEAAEAETEEEE